MVVVGFMEASFGSRIGFVPGNQLHLRAA